MKPEPVSFGRRDMGDDWKEYIRPISLAGKQLRGRPAASSSCANHSKKRMGNRPFANRHRNIFQVDQFLRQLAVHTGTVNLDSVLCTDNYSLPQSTTLSSI